MITLLTLQVRFDKMNLSYNYITDLGFDIFNNPLKLKVKALKKLGLEEGESLRECITRLDVCID